MARTITHKTAAAKLVAPPSLPKHLLQIRTVTKLMANERTRMEVHPTLVPVITILHDDHSHKLRAVAFAITRNVALYTNLFTISKRPSHARDKLTRQIVA